MAPFSLLDHDKPPDLSESTLCLPCGLLMTTLPPELSFPPVCAEDSPGEEVWGFSRLCGPRWGGGPTLTESTRLATVPSTVGSIWLNLRLTTRRELSSRPFHRCKSEGQET